MSGFMHVFLLLDNPNLTFSRTLFCGVGLRYLYSNLLLKLAKRYCSLLHQTFCSASVSDGLFVSSKLPAGLLFILTRCLRSNAVLQQPFFSSLSTIFGSVGCMRSVFSSLQRTVNALHQGHMMPPVVYYACGAASAKCFLVI